MTKSKLRKKWQKLIYRITAKRNANLQTLTKIHVMFQKDLAKTVEGVAFTSVYDGQSDGQIDRRTQCLLTLTGRHKNVQE